MDAVRRLRAGGGYEPGRGDAGRQDLASQLRCLEARAEQCSSMGFPTVWCR